MSLTDPDTVLYHLKVPAIAKANGEKGEACAKGYGRHGDDGSSHMPSKVPESQFNDHQRPLPMASTGEILAALKSG
jgi:hypothetical protein